MASPVPYLFLAGVPLVALAAEYFEVDDPAERAPVDVDFSSINPPRSP